MSAISRVECKQSTSSFLPAGVVLSLQDYVQPSQAKKAQQVCAKWRHILDVSKVLNIKYTRDDAWDVLLARSADKDTRLVLSKRKVQVNLFLSSGMKAFEHIKDSWPEMSAESMHIKFKLIDELEERLDMKLGVFCTVEDITDAIWGVEDSLWASFSQKKSKDFPRELEIFNERVLRNFSTFQAYEAITNALSNKMGEHLRGKYLLT